MYARIDGFLGHWYVDIGDHVDKGQLLAVIDAPDTDAELAQSEAALLQANANVKTAEVNLQLANATYDRYHGLLATGSVTQQDLDTRQTNAAQAASSKAAADAAVKSAQATVDRLKAQKSFEKITAPFAGTITFRNYDVGARISSSDTAIGHELFDIADTDKLRIYVNVPQAYVTLLQINQPVSFISQRNYGTRPFYGYVARSAGALDPQTRTLLTELDFDNKDHLLWSGMYGEVHISTHKDHPTLTVPTAAMMFEAGGTQLAIVDGDNKVHFKKVTLGEDLGTRLEVVGGLTATDQVVTNPGEKLAEGVEVQIAGNDQPKAQTVADAPQTAGPTTRMAAVDPTAADAPAMATSGGSSR
jgi:RND family efflux transporter MFP subunit